MEEIDLRQRCEEVVTAYPPELLRRALSYLYNKETKGRSYGLGDNLLRQGVRWQLWHGLLTVPLRRPQVSSCRPGL